MILGWIANIYLIVGIFLVGKKWRHAFLFYLVGEVLWTLESIRIERFDMVFLCVVFACMAAYNWWTWTRDEPRIKFRYIGEMKPKPYPEED